MPSKRDWEAGPGKRVSAFEKCIDDRYFHTISNEIFSCVRNQWQISLYGKVVYMHKILRNLKLQIIWFI